MKKNVSDVYIAVTHYLTSVFVPTFIAGIITAMIIVPIVATEFFSDDVLPFLVFIIALLAKAAAIVLGTKYSYKWISKRYEIKNPSKVVNISAGIAVVLWLLWNVSIMRSSPVEMLVSVVVTLSLAALFYFSSRRLFLGSSSVQVSTQEEVSQSTETSAAEKENNSWTPKA